MAKTTVDKILKIARAEVGTRATNVKRCKYNTAFYGTEVSGDCYDWCAAFVWWVFKQAGADDMLFCKTAGCGVLAQTFYNKGKIVRSGYKAGDVVLFHWSNEASTIVPGAYAVDHVGIIESVNSDGSYTTIEGNTGGGNGSVLRQKRWANCISYACRPDYVSSGSSTTNKEEEEMIKYGLHNTAILAFKKQLITLYNMGIIKTKVDNSDGFGDGTLKAVKEAQKAGKVTVDGIVGEKTINAIYHLINDGIRAKDTKIANAKRALG